MTFLPSIRQARIRIGLGYGTITPMLRLPFFLLYGFVATPALQAQQPNIVIVMADDLGWGDPGYAGGNCLTPELDRLAADGVVLDRFYAASPVCSPTRGSVLTGRHPFRYGIRNANIGHLPKEEWTLGEACEQAGYATGLFGKWHLGTLTTELRDSNRGGLAKHDKHFNPPHWHGFQEVFCTEAKVPTWDPMVHPDTGEPYGTRFWEWSGGELMVAQDNLEGDDSRVIVDRVLPFLDEHGRNSKPLLAVVWLHAPHLPVLAQESDTQPFDDLPPEARHYRGCVRALDREVGRIRTRLEDLGQWDNTLFVFCSDNGPEGNSEARGLGSTGGLRGRKRSLYEGGVRVPGLVHWPAGGLQGGRRSTAPTGTLDLLPTIQGIGGFPSPADALPMDGMDALELWGGTRKQREQPMMFQTNGMRTWVGDRYKLVVRRAKQEEHVELYDLLEDPAETTDLAPAQPERVARLRAQLEVWSAGLDAPR